MAKSKLGFHTGPGGKKDGLGNWERALNQAGQPFGLKAADEYGPLFEAVEIGRQHNVQNWLGFRFSEAAHRISREVPDYDVAPWEDAPILCQEIIDKLPREFDKSVWLEPINEPRDENSGSDTIYNNLNATDYLGEWCLAAAIFLNERGYKFMGPSFNAGRPGREGLPVEDAVVQYSQPGMLKFLRYCAENPDKAGLSVHDYSWSTWQEGQTVEDWYPRLWGRFEAAIAAADIHGIPRTFPIFVTEFGFAHREAPVWPEAEAYLDARNEMLARWPQVKYDAAWTLQEGWGAIDHHVNSWLQYPAQREFDEGEQPARTHPLFGGTLPGDTPIVQPPTLPEEPVTPPVTPPPITMPPPQPPVPIPPTTDGLLSLKFTGWGERDVAHNPANGPATWYDVRNVQVPIIGGQRMIYWEAEGHNQFADGKPWNNFAAPEGIHKWDKMLPAHEHYLLNESGRTYHLFGPSHPWWVRYSHRLHLAPGTYHLRLDIWGDWVDIVNEQKRPKPDPGHARVELFVGERGREQWLRPNYHGQSLLEREFTIETAGEYEVGFGILTVYAAGGSPGANGCFLRSFTVEPVQQMISPPLPVEQPHQPAPPPPAALMIKRVATPAGVWLRSGPSTSHDTLHHLLQGTLVEVLAEGEWDQVQVWGKTGYVSSRFLEKV